MATDAMAAGVGKTSYSRQQILALTASTLAFAVNFAIWVMFSVIGIKINGELNLNETEFGLLVATPILTGSLVRLPLGILTDRYGGRIVFFSFGNGCSDGQSEASLFGKQKKVIPIKVAS